MATYSTTPLDYNGYVTQLCTMAVVLYSNVGGVVTPSDAAVQAIIPQMLNYAELRIQRDLDLLPLRTTRSTYTTTAASQVLTIPTGDWITIETVQITTATGTQTLLPVAREYIQTVWNGSYQGPPTQYAMSGGDLATAGQTSNLLLLGPTPDQAYPVTITGLIRQPTLNQYNSSGFASGNYTFISTYYPDLLIMGSMVYISAFQRNFGRESDDPQMAQSYENQYQTLLRGAGTEEYRKKGEASAWTAKSASPVATPTRP